MTLACIAFNACTDEEIYKSSEIVEGVPVEVGFKFTIPSMQKVSTRGLSDEGEFQVNDLYVSSSMPTTTRLEKLEEGTITVI